VAGRLPAAGYAYLAATLATGLYSVAALVPALGRLLPGARLLAGPPGAGSAVTTAVLAALVVACEYGPGWWRRLKARPVVRRAAEGAAGASSAGGSVSGPTEEAPGEAAWAPYLPVLMAGALLLPPAAAALVPLPGAVLAVLDRTVRRAGALRPLWNGAQLAVSTAVAGCVFRSLGGPGLLAAALPGAGGRAGLPIPVLLLPVWLAEMTLLAVSTALVAGARATSEPPRAAGAGAGVAAGAGADAGRSVPGGRSLPAGRMSGPVAGWCRGGRAALTAGLVPVLVHGLMALLIAALWAGPYGPFAAVLVLLPLAVSGWMHAQYDRERQAHRATVRALVQAVEIKDGYTRGHSERVGRASVLMAYELLMPEERIASLRVAGTLHDVGKLGVPTRVLRKNGPLGPGERLQVEKHPEYGHEMVRGIGFLGEARAGILHHHERWDGRGYPYGLAGHDIPEFARVIAVADAFDSMTSTRSYRRGRPVPEAMAELERCAGSQFDPVMVRALVAAVRRHGWNPPASPGAARTAAEAASIPDIPLGVPEPDGVPASGGPAPRRPAPAVGPAPAAEPVPRAGS